MRRRILVLTVAAIMALTMALAGPASAQGLLDWGTSIPDVDFDFANVPNSCELEIIEEIAEDRGISEERADRIFDKLRAGEVEDLVDEVCGGSAS